MSESIWDDPRITTYVLGEMSGDEQAAFEAEVQSDAALAAAVEEARGVTDQIQSLYANESTPPLDPERRRAIVGADTKSVALPNANAMSWRVPGLVLAAAAVLLVLVGIAPWLRQQEGTVAMDDPLAKPMAKPAKNLTKLGKDEVVAGAVELDKKMAPEAGRLPASGDQQVEAFQPKLQAHPDAPDRPLTAPNGVTVDSEKSDAFRGSPLPTKAADQGFGGGGAAPSANSAKAGGSRRDQAQALGGGAQQAPATPPKPMPAQPGGESAAKRQSGGIQAAQKGLSPVAEPAPGEVRGRQQTRKMSNPFGDSAEEADDRDEAKPDVERLKQEVKELAKIEQVVKEAQEQMEDKPVAVRAIDGQPAANQQAGQLLDRLAVRSELKGRGMNRAPLDATKELLELPANPAAAGFGEANPDGVGPGKSGDQFEPITDNAFKRVSEAPLSTFSVDVDTASYSKTRDFLMRANQLPRPDAVRIEEFINYFEYDYKAPPASAEHPFAAHVELTTCPWNPEHQLARIALKGKTMTKGERPACNLVFLLDVSGSMNAPNKLPLVIEGMKMLIDQLSEKDQVAITVYAGGAGLVLDSTSAKKDKKIRKALTELRAGGSTAGGAGIALAYQTARDNFISDGVNRVILCTDGDFNVGVTGTDELVRLVEQEAKGNIFLSVLGFGMGNHNDAMLEKISGRGNGNYAFIDTVNEAKKVLVDQTNGTLVTIAKDVKLQVDFNGKHVSQYRLIGYENRILAKEDFADDKVDAGDIGAGHAVTALYELVPAGQEADASQPPVDPSEFQTKPELTAAADSDVVMNLRLRYKPPAGDNSTLVVIPIKYDVAEFDKASDDVRFAAAVAGFGMSLRRSPYAGSWTLSDVIDVAKSAKGEDEYELRDEFVELVRKASALMGEE